MAGRLGASTEEGRGEGESGDDGEGAREREREGGKNEHWEVVVGRGGQRVGLGEEGGEGLLPRCSHKSRAEKQA